MKGLKRVVKHLQEHAHLELVKRTRHKLKDRPQSIQQWQKQHKTKYKLITIIISTTSTITIRGPTIINRAKTT